MISAPFKSSDVIWIRSINIGRNEKFTAKSFVHSATIRVIWYIMILFWNEKLHVFFLIHYDSTTLQWPIPSLRNSLSSSMTTLSLPSSSACKRMVRKLRMHVHFMIQCYPGALSAPLEYLLYNSMQNRKSCLAMGIAFLQIAHRPSGVWMCSSFPFSSIMI
jgi:hypothetical protein